MLRILCFAAVILAALLLPHTVLAATKEFSAQTNYMSAAGYARWQHFLSYHVWLPRG